MPSNWVDLCTKSLSIATSEDFDDATKWDSRLNVGQAEGVDSLNDLNSSTNECDPPRYMAAPHRQSRRINPFAVGRAPVSAPKTQFDYCT